MGKIKLFKDIWKASNIKGETFIQKMFINYNRITLDRDISQVQLLPVEDGFEVIVVSTELKDEGIDVEISHPGVDSGISYHKKISAQGILYITEPLNPDDKQFQFIPYFSDDILAPDSGNLNFRLTREKNNVDLQSYISKHLLFNLITKDKQGNPKNASINIYQLF